MGAPVAKGLQLYDEFFPAVTSFTRIPYIVHLGRDLPVIPAQMELPTGFFMRKLLGLLAALRRDVGQAAAIGLDVQCPWQVVW